MAEIKQAKFIDRTGQEADAVFVGAEKAIYDDSGKRLDQKLEERKRATGLLASDTQGILGNIGAEVSLQSIIDKVAEKIMRELVSNSSLTQTLANYVTKAMMSGTQVNDGNKVPTSALAYAMQQAITQNADAITQLNSEVRTKAFTVQSLVGPKDINTIVEPGIYYINSSPETQNLPVSNTNGMLFVIVIDSNNLWQYFRQYSQHTFYGRYCSRGSWVEWVAQK